MGFMRLIYLLSGFDSFSVAVMKGRGDWRGPVWWIWIDCLLMHAFGWYFWIEGLGKMNWRAGERRFFVVGYLFVGFILQAILELKINIAGSVVRGLMGPL